MKKVVFVPHCILNQSAREYEKEKTDGSLKEIVKIFAEAEIGIIQLPCPEVEFNLDSRFRKNYKDKYRDCCREISLKILKEIKNYLERDYNVLGILGVEFSRTCGVYRIENGKRVIPGKGILTEELEREMQKENFQVPIISVNVENVFSTLEKLNLLIKNS